ncbi:hypothetical protein KUCAC02_019826, partial [Chaenocephalus aceratus]
LRGGDGEEGERGLSLQEPQYKYVEPAAEGRSSCRQTDDSTAQDITAACRPPAVSLEHWPTR